MSDNSLELGEMTALFKKSFLLLCLLVLLAPSLAAADNAKNERLKDFVTDEPVKTDKYVPGKTDFPSGVYSYSVRWQGVRVAKANIVVEKDEVGKPYFHVRTEARTVSGIDWLYSLHHRVESVFDAKTFEPSRFYQRQIENSRQKYRKVYFAENGDIVAHGWKNGKNNDPITFNTGNATLDPISASFIARSLPVNVGSKVNFDVFNGNRRYIIDFEVAGKEKMEYEGEEREVFKVVPHVTRIKDGKQKREKRLKSATIWITADDRRDIVKVKSKVLIGSITAELDGFYPEAIAPSKTLRAQKAGDRPTL